MHFVNSSTNNSITSSRCTFKFFSSRNLCSFPLEAFKGAPASSSSCPFFFAAVATAGPCITAHASNLTHACTHAHTYARAMHTCTHARTHAHTHNRLMVLCPALPSEPVPEDTIIHWRSWGRRRIRIDIGSMAWELIPFIMIWPSECCQTQPSQHTAEVGRMASSN